MATYLAQDSTTVSMIKRGVFKFTLSNANQCTFASDAYFFTLHRHENILDRKLEQPIQTYVNNFNVAAEKLAEAVETGNDKTWSKNSDFWLLLHQATILNSIIYQEICIILTQFEQNSPSLKSVITTRPNWDSSRWRRRRGVVFVRKIRKFVGQGRHWR